jgi:hypothetical protein
MYRDHAGGDAIGAAAAGEHCTAGSLDRTVFADDDAEDPPADSTSNE